MSGLSSVSSSQLISDLEALNAVQVLWVLFRDTFEMGFSHHFPFLHAKRICSQWSSSELRSSKQTFKLVRYCSLPTNIFICSQCSINCCEVSHSTSRTQGFVAVERFLNPEICACPCLPRSGLGAVAAGRDRGTVGPRVPPAAGRGLSSAEHQDLSRAAVSRSWDV